MLHRRNVDFRRLIPRSGQFVGRPAEPLNNSICERLGTQLAFAQTRPENVGCVDTIFQRDEPCIIDLLSVFGKTKVDQHLNGTVEQPGRIGDVFARDIRR